MHYCLKAAALVRNSSSFFSLRSIHRLHRHPLLSFLHRYRLDAWFLLPLQNPRKTPEQLSTDRSLH
jgi:hypothetical protein